MLLSAFGGQGWRQLAPSDAPNLYGIWQVDGFSAEGYRRDPLLTDELRWRRVIFDRPFLMSDPVMVTVQHMDDSFEVFGGTIERAHPLHRSRPTGSKLGAPTEETPATNPARPTGGPMRAAPNRIVIDGEDFAGHRIHAWFTRMDPANVPTRRTGLQLDPGATLQSLRPPKPTRFSAVIPIVQLAEDQTATDGNLAHVYRNQIAGSDRCPIGHLVGYFIRELQHENPSYCRHRRGCDVRPGPGDGT